MSRQSGRRTSLSGLGRGLVILFAVLLAFGGCDSDPSGPGTVLVRLSAPNLGAAVLEVEGSGIRGFEGRGATQVYSAAVPGRSNVHRVILVDPVGGEISVDIRVDDVRMEGPMVTLVQAARDDNATEAVRNVAVTVER
jgi:hypothetical protein